MTMPSGLAMWGQGGDYNAADDRRVIHALSGRRVGIIRRPDLRAGTGLEIIVPAWLGVVDLQDGTSVVIGSGSDASFNIPAGPASGSRVDYLWADVDAAAGTWQLSLLSASAIVNRVGLLLATITAPAGANTAAAMSWAVPSLTFGGAGGLLARGWMVDTTARTATTFAAAGDFAVTPAVRCYIQRVYRVIAYTPQALYTANVGTGQNFRSAINRGPGSNQLGSASMDYFGSISQGQSVTTMWVGTLAAGEYTFSVRYWSPAGGTFRPDYSGQGILLTVEDLGPTNAVWA